MLKMSREKGKLNKEVLREENSCYMVILKLQLDQ